MTTLTPEDRAETVQHCWKEDGTTFCGEDVEPLTLASAEEARAIPCCTPCHRRAMSFRAVLQEQAEAAVQRVRAQAQGWIDEYSDPVYRDNGWAQGVVSAATEVIRTLDGDA